MPDTDVNFAPPPETLTADERLAELAKILATAVDRVNPATINENCKRCSDPTFRVSA